jgi:RimJ/RimL family protein N-acetyltransferase
VPFIVDAIVAASRHGHFSCDGDRPDILRGLWHQVDSVVADGRMPMPGARDGVGGQAVVVQVGDAQAGCGIVIEHLPGSWRERIEIFAMVVDERFRGRGLGKHAVRSLVTWAESRVVYARCAPVSMAMQRMLQACGFIATEVAENGSAILEFYGASSYAA